MNLGSSKKWIELINSTKYNLIDFPNDPLTYKDDSGIIFYSPCGVLEEFISKMSDKFSEVDMAFMNSDKSSMFFISDNTKKKVKAKTNLSIVDEVFMFLGLEATIRFITKNYEAL